MVSPTFTSAKVLVDEKVVPAGPLVPVTRVAIVGLSKRGFVNVPKLVTSQTDFIRRFGGFFLDSLDPDPAKQFQQSYGSLLALRVLAAGGHVVFTRIGDGTETKAFVDVDLQPVPAYILGTINLTGGIDTRVRNLLHIRLTDGGTVTDKEIIFPKNKNLPFSSIISQINTQFGMNIAFMDKSKKFLLLKTDDGLSTHFIPSEIKTTVSGITQNFTLNKTAVHPDTYFFTIVAGVKIIRGKDNGLGSIVDNGSSTTDGSPPITITGGTINYSTGSVSVTLSSAVNAGYNIDNNYFYGEIDTTVASDTQTWSLNKGSIVPDSFLFTIRVNATDVIKGKDDGTGAIIDNGSIGSITVSSGTINYTTGAVTVTLSGAIGANLNIVSHYEYNISLELLPASQAIADIATVLFGFGTKSSQVIHKTGRSTRFQSVDPGSSFNNAIVEVSESQNIDFGIKVRILMDNVVVSEYDNLTFQNFQTFINSKDENFEVISTGEIGFPNVGVYFLSGGSDGTLNLSREHWLVALDKLFKSEEDFDILCLPGIWDPDIILGMLAEVSKLDRKDFFIVLDAPSTLSLSEVIDFKHGNLPGYNTKISIQSEFASLTYPWTKETVGVFNDIKIIPASIAKVVSMVKTDLSIGPWGAPAGKTRGLLDVVDTTVKVSLNDANSLVTFPNNINPIVFFPDTGFVIWGQKTLSGDVTALTTRENVVRNKVYLIKQIKKILQRFLFETITDSLLILAGNAVISFLSLQQSKGGIVDFRVISDSSVNPPELVADNQFQVFVTIQPVTVAEIITLQFIVTSNIGVALA